MTQPITNIEDRYLPLYMVAIERNGDTSITVRNVSIGEDQQYRYSLWYSGESDLERFWFLFDDLAPEFGYDPVRDSLQA